MVIDWGDGAADIFSVDPQQGFAFVVGAYRYAQSGEFTAKVFLLDENGYPLGVLRNYSVTVLPDEDGDGVDDAAENAAPHGGDGNSDGVPDRQQPHVASLPTIEDGTYLTIVAPDGISLAEVNVSPLTI